MSTTRWVVVAGGWLWEVAVAVAVVGCCGVIGDGCCWGWLLGLVVGVGGWFICGGVVGSKVRQFASCVKRDVNNRPRATFGPDSSTSSAADNGSRYGHGHGHHPCRTPGCRPVPAKRRRSKPIRPTNVPRRPRHQSWLPRRRFPLSTTKT